MSADRTENWILLYSWRCFWVIIPVSLSFINIHKLLKNLLNIKYLMLQVELIKIGLDQEV